MTETVRTFSEISEVIAFLEAQGFRATKTVYRHRSEGKLKPGDGGLYTEAACLRYAKAHLKRRESGLTKGQEDAVQQDHLAAARTDLIREQTMLARRKREVEEGKYILKSAAAQNLAARAVMLKTGLKQHAADRVAEWIHLVGGDPKRAPELLRAVLDGYDRVLADYARADSVVLVAAEQPAEFETDIEPQPEQED